MSDANNSIVVTALPVAANMAATDQFLIIYNSTANVSVGNGSPQVRLINVSSMGANLLISNSAPAASNSFGVPGMVAYGANDYFYLCVAGNTWVKTQLTTW